MPKKNVVILGAGFGGLRAATVVAKGLRRRRLLGRWNVVLVDRNDHHTYTPLLYEVATTSKETADICRLHEVAAYPLKPLLARLPVELVRGEAKPLDPASGEVLLEDGRKIPCEYLVIALGSEPNYFGIKGLAEHALPFKTFRDAIRVRDAVWNLAMDQSRRNPIRILLGGAGSTGIELAAELKEWCGELEDDFPRCKLDVRIIEAAPSILPGFAPNVIRPVLKRLARLGVGLSIGKKIAGVEPAATILEGGEKIPFDIFVWTGGVKASSAVSGAASLQKEPRGRAVVEKEMECLPQTPNLKLNMKIYGLGDSACFVNPATGKPIPGVARAAILQGNVAGRNILQDILAEEKKIAAPRYRTFAPSDYPYVIPVGGKYAVAKIGPLVVRGLPAWIFKGLVELHYLLSVMPAWKAAATWLRGLRIFIQNDRLG